MRDEVGSQGPASSAFFLPEVAPVTSAVWLALGAMLLLGLVDLVYKRGVAEYSWVTPQLTEGASGAAGPPRHR